MAEPWGLGLGSLGFRVQGLGLKGLLLGSGFRARVGARFQGCWFKGLLGGSWSLVSRVISTSIGAISNYNRSYLTYNPTY